MAEIHLPQFVANTLIAMAKRRCSEEHWSIQHEKVSIPLESHDRTEQFLLDLNRGKIELTKRTLQNRARQCIVLLRLDLGGPDHRNPDGELIPCPHLHVYREGYGTKWAHALPAEIFTEPSNFALVLDQFMDYCNVTDKPVIAPVLF